MSAGGMRTMSNTYINSNKIEWRITIGRDRRIGQLRLQSSTIPISMAPIQKEKKIKYSG